MGMTTAAGHSSLMCLEACSYVATARVNDDAAVWGYNVTATIEEALPLMEDAP
jgi:hypothetical protein